jgi:hypothetical protein
MALRHGRYRIVGEAGSAEQRVMRDDYTPLRTTFEVALPLSESATLRRLPPNSALTLGDFEARIIERSASLPPIERVRP